MDKANKILEIDRDYIKKQVIYLIIGTPFFILFWIFDAVFGIKSVYFLFTIIIILGFYIIIFTISQQKWLNKYNKIIQEIEIEEDSIFLRTSKILWKKEKEFQIKFSDIKYKRKNMYWWAKKGRNKETLIFNIQGNEYYLISEYFDDIDVLIDRLEKIVS